MTNNEPSNRPTHRVFAVRKNGGDKAFWTQIGAAWSNQDGKGFNLKLYLVPTDGADIVMREAKDEGDSK